MNEDTAILKLHSLFFKGKNAGIKVKLTFDGDTEYVAKMKLDATNYYIDEKNYAESVKRITKRIELKEAELRQTYQMKSVVLRRKKQ